MIPGSHAQTIMKCRNTSAFIANKKPHPDKAVEKGKPAPKHGQGPTTSSDKQGQGREGRARGALTKPGPSAKRPSAAK